MRAPDAAFASQTSEEGNSLDGLAETHLISQDTVEPLVMECHEPVQAYDLVLAQLACEHEGDLGENVGRLEVDSHGLEGFRHLDGHVRQGGHLLIIVFFRLLEVVLRVVNSDQVGGNGLLRSSLCVAEHALLDEAFGVELLGDFD